MPDRLVGQRRPRRRRPSLVATRVTPGQKDWIVTLARLEGRTVTNLIYDLVVPAVKERLEQRLGDLVAPE